MLSSAQTLGASVKDNSGVSINRITCNFDTKTELTQFENQKVHKVAHHYSAALDNHKKYLKPETSIKIYDNFLTIDTFNWH